MNFESSLNDIFAIKAPALPTNIRDIIVKITPYFTIISVVISIPAILALFGIGTLVLPFALMGKGIGIATLVSAVILVSSAYLEITAINGLFARRAAAWRKLFYVSLLSAISALLGGNITGLIIGSIISWYFLFQVRSQYR